jgi:hypothetical protein
MTPFTASAIGCAHNRERNYSTGAQHGITHGTVSTACLVGVCAVELQQLLSGEVASQSTVEPLAQIHAEIQIHKAAQFWSADPAAESAPAACAALVSLLCSFASATC